MNKVISAFLKPFVKVNNFREHLENDFAEIFKKIDESSKVEEVEIQLMKKGYQSLGSYYGVGSTVPDSGYETLARATKKAIRKANHLIQKQLRK